ncbi:MAG: hypothetical protein AB1657_00170 [Candidatus Micrarchaeota archaeon]
MEKGEMDMFRKILGAIGLLTVLAGLGFATGTITTIQTGICSLYTMVNTILAGVIFVLIVLAAVTYAAGQVMGAETRARASVWATSMVVGAVIGIIIYVLLPTILGYMLTGSPLTSCTQSI